MTDANPRPWTAQQLKAHFEYRRVQARITMLGPASAAQARAVAMNLDSFIDNRKDRLAVLCFLTGRELKSSKELTKAEASLIITWTNGDDEIVKQEAERLLTAALEAEGQMKLF